MTKTLKSILKYSISLLLAAVLLYLAFQSIDLKAFYNRLSTVDYKWVIFSIIISIFSFWLRAYRWKLLLEPMNYNVSTRRVILAVLTGYLVNLAVPRLGEISRCGVLRRNDNVPFINSFGTVITERVIDVVTMLLLVLIGFTLEFDKLMLFFEQNVAGQLPVNFNLWVVFIVVLFNLALVAGLIIIIYRAFRNHPFLIKIKALIKGLINGIVSIIRLKKRFEFLFATLLLWVIYFFMSYFIVFSLSETSDLSPLAGLMILITGSLAMVVPVQGGIGAFHLFVSAILILYGIEKTTSLFFATILHTSQLFAISFFGGIALLISFLFVKHDRNVQENSATSSVNTNH